MLDSDTRFGTIESGEKGTDNAFGKTDKYESRAQSWCFGDQVWNLEDIIAFYGELNVEGRKYY